MHTYTTRVIFFLHWCGTSLYFDKLLEKLNGHNGNLCVSWIGCVHTTERFRGRRQPFFDNSTQRSIIYCEIYADAQAVTVRYSFGARKNRNTTPFCYLWYEKGTEYEIWFFLNNAKRKFKRLTGISCCSHLQFLKRHTFLQRNIVNDTNWYGLRTEIKDNSCLLFGKIGDRY